MLSAKIAIYQEKKSSAKNISKSYLKPFTRAARRDQVSVNKSADQSIHLEPAAAGARCFPARPADGSVVLPGTSSLKAPFLSWPRGGSAGPTFLPSRVNSSGESACEILTRHPASLGGCTGSVAVQNGETVIHCHPLFHLSHCSQPQLHVPSPPGTLLKRLPGELVTVSPQPGLLGWWSGKGMGAPLEGV